MRAGALLVVALFAAGCLGPAAEVAPTSLGTDLTAMALPKVFSGILHESVDVPAAGGLEVHLDLWRPDPATYAGAAGGAEAAVPVVFDMGPYFGGTKENAERRVAHPVHDWA